MPSSWSVGKSCSTSRSKSEYSVCRTETGWTACATDGLRAGLAEAEVLHLARLDQFLDGARDVLDRHVRIDAVLVEDIDLVNAQVAQAVVGDRADVVRAAVETQALLGPREAELGGQHDLVAEVAHGGAKQNLVVARAPAVELGGVEEGDAQVVGVAYGGDARLLVTRAVAMVRPIEP